MIAADLRRLSFLLADEHRKRKKGRRPISLSQPTFTVRFLEDTIAQKRGTSLAAACKLDNSDSDYFPGSAAVCGDVQSLADMNISSRVTMTACLRVASRSGSSVPSRSATSSLSRSQKPGHGEGLALQSDVVPMAHDRCIGQTSLLTAVGIKAKLSAKLTRQLPLRGGRPLS